MVKLTCRTALIALGLLAAPAFAQITATGMASGQGTLDQGRKFALSARINADGTASGQATLINKNFTGDKPGQPYQLHVTVTCGKKLDDHSAIFGGMTQKTNDSNLVDAVYFSVQDNGEPGAGQGHDQPCLLLRRRSRDHRRSQIVPRLDADRLAARADRQRQHQRQVIACPASLAVTIRIASAMAWSRSSSLVSRWSASLASASGAASRPASRSSRARMSASTSSKCG